MLTACDNIEKLIIVEMRRRGIPRGFKWTMYEIVRKTSPEPLILAAARVLDRAPMRVGLVTGAAIPEVMPAGENDGPFGSVVLARVLIHLGHQVTIYTEPKAKPPIEFLVEWFGIDISVVNLVRGDETLTKRIADGTDVLVAIERLGANINGHLYGMTGECRDPHRFFIDDCFRLMADQGKPTISIADGGNEIGFGKVYDELTTRLPELNIRDKTPCGGGIISAVGCDVLVIASVSNLGAYGVVAALALLREDASLCHTPEEEIAMHHIGVGLGLVDGGGGGRIPSCDGVPAKVCAAVVLMIRNIVERTLEAPRSRSF